MEVGPVRVLVVSSISDLARIPPSVKHIHIRKNGSKKLFKLLLASKNFESVSITKSMLPKIKPFLANFKGRGIRVYLLKNRKGRFSLLDNFLLHHLNNNLSVEAQNFYEVLT